MQESTNPFNWIAIFLLLILSFAIATPIYMRWMFRFYYKLETYHDPSDERLLAKIYKLWVYNTVVSVFATGVTVLYGPFITSAGISVTLETVLSASIIIAVMNFTIRITSYSHLGALSDELPISRLKEDAHNVGYSFMVSLWFLIFIGIGLNVANGKIMRTFPLPTLSPPKALAYIVIIILSPAILAILSELWLYFANVPDELVDDYDR